MTKLLATTHVLCLGSLVVGCSSSTEPQPTPQPKLDLSKIPGASHGPAPTPPRASALRSAPRPALQQSRISSEITWGSRTKDPYIDEWDINIEVSVTGEGPAFDWNKSTTLSLYGLGTYFLTDSQRWSIFPLEEGWPNEYMVKAEYYEFGDSEGEVVITIAVHDFGHRTHGTRVYSATHSIVWNDRE